MTRFLPIAAALLLAGCALTATQQEAVRGFAGASTQIGAFASSELTRMRNAAIEMNATNEEIGGRPDPKGLDSGFDPDDIIARVAAAEALSSYGSLLQALVDDTQEEELEKASGAFVSSFSSLAASDAVAGRIPALDDKQTAALGEIVIRIGGLIVEAKKARAVKQIVLETQVAVDQVIKLLIEGFTINTGITQSFGQVVDRLENGVAVAPRNSAAERKAAVAGKRQALASSDQLAHLVPQAKEALEQLRRAHAELVAALKDDDEVSLPQIRAMGKEVKSLADATRVLVGS